MPFYGAQQWDPRLICAQIVALQSICYITIGMFLALFHSLFGTALNLDQFFAYYTVTASTSTGWAVIIAHLLNSFVCAIFLCIIVERSKKCLDFAFTTHLMHLVFCSMYAGVPKNWEWWIINGLSLTAMAVVGEYMCMRRELRDIRIGDFLSLRQGTA